jgi:NADH:ubiquinone oxidoreductase subunit K
VAEPLLAARVALDHVLIVGGILFAIGLYIALAKRNAVAVLMGIELMLNAVNLTLIAFSRFIRFEDGARALDGHVFAVFVITVAAAEAAVALALVVAVYRHRGTIDVDRINVLRW